MTEMNGTRAALTRSTTPIVLTSCISEYVPSCMRAPPEEETMISGMRSAMAASPARATFSPTTEPIEPPMKPKSMTHIETGLPPIVADAPDRRVAQAGRELGGHEPVRIGLEIHEAERVDRLEVGVALHERAAVDQLLDPGLGRDAEVVAAMRADPQRLVELLVEEHLRAARALGPQVRAGRRRGVVGTAI
jgi:hypothetical protein